MLVALSRRNRGCGGREVLFVASRAPSAKLLPLDRRRRRSFGQFEAPCVSAAHREQ